VISESYEVWARDHWEQERITEVDEHAEDRCHWCGLLSDCDCITEVQDPRVEEWHALVSAA
jgi:hypothetical protein